MQAGGPEFKSPCLHFKLIMKKTILLSLLGVTAFLGASCTPGERGAVAGGAVGAGVGALIGDSTGALIGGAVGAVAGSELTKNRAYRNRQPQPYYNYPRPPYNHPRPSYSYPRSPYYNY